jgi:hypothetical protein
LAKKNQKWWTRKRKVNVFLIGLFIFWFCFVLTLPLNFFLFGIPEISWTTTGNVDGFRLISTSREFPPVSFQYIITFTALGSYSVNNPIKTTVSLTNVSLPNFLEYYQAVGFSNAYDSPFKYNEEGSVNSSSILLESLGNNNYKGSGTIIWMVEGDEYGPIVFPKNTGGSLPMESIKQSLPYVITISSVSDTLTQTYNESTLKIGLLLASFSPLILQPVIEAIVLKPDNGEINQE